MAKQLNMSTKQIQINKANSSIVLVVGIAAFLTVFSVVASKSLLARRSYQAKVIGLQEQARDQLGANIQAVDQLKVSYQSFVGRPENIIAGNSQGSGERDGDNAKIVLDALPSVYDFPALTSSLEKIMDDRGYAITNISGTDNEAGQSTSSTGSQTSKSSTAASQPVGSSVDMPFEIGARASYASATELLEVFRNSIRPFYVQRVIMTATEKDTVELRVIGKTFYQPETTLKITEEIVQ
jgi:hypothetical protein